MTTRIPPQITTMSSNLVII